MLGIKQQKHEREQLINCNKDKIKILIKIKSNISMYVLILCIYVLCILILCVYITYIKVNYAINIIHEKAFRSDLSAQIKKPLL